MKFVLSEDERGRFATVHCDAGGTFLIDADDLPILGEHQWRVRNFDSQCWYVCCTNSGTVLLHREIMAAPKRLTVDHRDGNGLNDRRYNLRLATIQQNLSNIHLTSRGEIGNRLRGVYDQGNGRHVVLISLAGKRHYLGTFTDPLEGARAYDAAARAARGEFTHLNFPDCS